MRRSGLAALVMVLALAAPASGQQPAAAPAPSAHQHATQEPARPAPSAPQDHSAHKPAAAALPPFVPPITDADRAAAFPDVKGHTVHDDGVNGFVLFDQLEWRGTGDGAASWDTRGWIGKDRDRLWIRTEGDGDEGRLERAHAHLLYGRAISRWWELVAGVRQDFRPGSPQTWAAFGIQGLAPWWFEVEATAYVGASGRTLVKIETEYELLLTNRLVLQPLVEFEIYGKDDPERGIGAGLSSGDAGLRLRYEIRREFAPYVGVVWTRKFFGTADQAEAAGGKAGGARLALGVRLWL